ncbi:MAG: F0F1 ATP synthase subunit A [Salinivirgaceae bacterium]|nr:F0F1 ATP synthase subunit A [Salinivirgaceae bacterium]
MKVANILSALALMLFTSVQVFGNTESEQAEKFNPTETIMEHIKDAHYWHFFDKKDAEGNLHPVAMPLPVIVYANNQLDVFMSSKFEHGHATVTCGTNQYILHHEKIYLANQYGQMEFDEAGNPTNVAALDFSITKNVASMMLSAVLLLLIFVGSARAYEKHGQVPTGLRGFTEPLILFVKEDIAEPNLGKNADRFLPYLLTVFFFIWINNMLGLLPASANLTGNIAVTFTLSFITMILTNVFASKHYWIEKFSMPGVPWWLQPVMTVVEFIGVISKPFALMIRLFANISAGHIIVLSLISLIFIFQTVFIAPVSIAFVLFMDVLELLVAALQAYIFTMLSALFIGLAVNMGAEHEH